MKSIKSVHAFLILYVNCLIGLTFVLGNRELSSSQNDCKALSLGVNQLSVVVQCYTSNNLVSNDCSSPQSTGSVAKITCQEHYTPFRRTHIKSHEKFVEIWCNSNGEWEGINKFEDFRCREDCGKLLSEAKPLIINGEVADGNLFPWHATIFKEIRPGNWKYICGASLIRNQVLVSAAHCFTLDRNLNVESKNFRIVLGTQSNNYSENIDKKGAEIHELHEVYISDNYDPRKGFQADIAIIQLKRKVNFTEYISPVCLPNDFTTDINAIRNGETGLLVGFGVTEDGKLSEMLRSASIKVQSTSECQRALARVLPESQFCAGESENGKFTTACFGDSGGGYIYQSKVFERYFIHGIVSSGEANKELKFCQNYAVFTRIYSFIFWILDKIEEINGEIARELLENVEFPFAFRGSETSLVQFTKLPREWENRITTLDLEYVSFSRENILEALEYARPLTSIKLNHVSFLQNDLTSTKTKSPTGSISNRVILPVLESFYLDLIEDDFKLDQIRTFPVPLTLEYLKSLIFFDKDYESTWTFSNLIQQEINIDLTVQIFKLLRINHDKGQIFINQIPFAEDIIKSTLHAEEFKVKEFAIYRSNFNAILWLDFFQSSEELSIAVLDDVLIPQNFVSILNTTKITTLVLNPTQKLSIDVTNLPASLEHLTLSNTVEFTFKDLERFQPLHKLEFFCCDRCIIDIKILKYFNQVFPKLQKIQFVHDKDIKLKVSSFGKMSSLKGILLQRKKLERSSYEDPWNESYITQDDLNQVIFNSFRKDYFWTSEGDYRLKLRLKSYEHKALETNLYEFIGTKSIQTSYKKFPGIPLELQSSIRQIKLQNVDLNARIFADSISNASNLKLVNFVDILLDDQNLRYNKLRGRNVIYRFKSLGLKDGNTFDYLEEYEHGKLLALLLPFQAPGIRFGGNNYTNTMHRLIVELNSLYMDWKTTVYFMYEVNYGEVRDESTHVVRSFGQFIDTNIELKEITHSIFKLYDTVVEGVLPREWKFTGFQLLNEEMINGFYQDKVLQFFGRLGIIQIMLEKYGSLITIQGSVDYENLKKPINFPPIPAMAASFNQDKID